MKSNFTCFAQIQGKNGNLSQPNRSGAGYGRLNTFKDAIRLAVLPVFLLLSGTAGAQISGTVFLDINSNGTQETAGAVIEPGIQGITVTAYNASNTAVATMVTGAVGTYSLSVPAGAYRVEFTWTDPYLKPSVAGGTTVQFVTAPNSTTNCATHYPFDYFPAGNTTLGITCFDFGDVVGASVPMVVTFPETAGASTIPGTPTSTIPSAYSSPAYTLEIAENVAGSVWGLAYDRKRDQLLTGAFVKRHSRLGSTNNPTTIYTMKPGATATNGVWLTLDPARTNPHGAVALWQEDYDVYDDVLKEGLGDIEINEDFTKLYAIDMGQRKLWEVPINANGSAGTPVSYNITTTVPGCPASDVRPMGIEINKGKVYVGMVCTGQSTVNTASIPLQGATSGSVGSGTPVVTRLGDPNALRGYIYEWNGGTSYTQLLDFPLNYDRGCLQRNFDANCEKVFDGDWTPWVDQFPYDNDGGDMFVAYPQPIISDIDFEDDGDMIIVLNDRLANQLGKGARVQDYDSGFRTVGDVFAAGDVLHACKSGATWILEEQVSGNAACGTAGTSNNVGGTKVIDEFYFDDDYAEDGYDRGRAMSNHGETTSGGVVQIPGRTDVMVAAFDPVRHYDGATYRFGVNWFSNTTGAWTKAYLMGESSEFGKAAAVGDLVAIAPPPPIQVGNYVWEDTDRDGVQDPGELGLSGVVVELWADTDGNGTVDTKVAQTTTNASGQYLFSMTGTNAVGGTENWTYFGGDDDAVEPNTAYQIRIATPTSTTRTTQNSAASGGVTTNDPVTDIRDSDLDSQNRISFTTGDAGFNNHGLDAGFYPACSVTVNSAVASACDPATNTYTLTVNVSYTNPPTGQITILGKVNNAGATLFSQNFTPDGTSPDTYVLTGLTANGTADIDVTAFFVNDAACTHTLADAFDAPVNCTPVCAITTITAIPSACNPATNTYSLDVTVTYANPPSGQITITTSNGGNQNFTPDGTSPDTYTLTGLTSNGVTGINVTATFVNNPSCTFTQNNVYDAPENCEPCAVTVTGAVPSACNPATNTYSVQVTVSYDNQPAGQIKITADGVTRFFTPDGTSPDTYNVMGLNADGPAAQSVTAMFVNDPACMHTLANAYTEPANCNPPCMITAVTAIPTACVPATNEYNLAVTVTYANSPGGNIVVTTTQGETVTVAATTSPQIIALNGINSDGTTGIGVTAYFEDAPSCTFSNNNAYNAPVSCQVRDWGDLPDNNTTANYPTNSTNGGEGVGPSHVIVPNLYMGTTVDSENNGQPNTNANGDDNAGAPDDEDGNTFNFNTDLVAGTTVTIPVTVLNNTGSNAHLYVFVDFNNNKTFDVLTERFSVPNIASNAAPATQNLMVAVPAGAIQNTNIGIRFRLGTNMAQSELPTGAANDGEVEDYIGQVSSYDWGDLPDGALGTAAGNYVTQNNASAADDGPSHRIYSTIRLGATVDAETDGQQSPNADGDDTNVDDENGTTLPMFIAGQTATVAVNVRNVTGTTAKLVGFFDWENDGDFDGTGEMVSMNIVNNTTGNVNMSVPVPATAVRNVNLGVRFRISTDANFVANMLPTGNATNGEVEDYVAQVMAFDWGDLIDVAAGNATGNYSTLLSDNGPRHKIVSGIQMGANIDFESDGVSSTTANGDDNAGAPDDEDAVTFPTMFRVGVPANVTVNVTNTTGANGTLYGWIDFNNDGVLDNATERAMTAVNDGTNAANVTLVFTPPASSVLNTLVGARFRLSTDGAAANATGSASDGEIEDYRVQIMAFDWGDLSDTDAAGSYPTNATDGAGEGVGPSHKLGYGIYFGSTVDVESDGQPNAAANGDDNTGAPDDEDGVTLPTFVAGRTATIPLVVTNMRGNGTAARISAWFDWNNDGVLNNTTERVSIANAVPDGYSGPYEINVTVPVTAVLNTNLGMRFRISQNNTVLVNPTGEAFDGEVEDYIGQVVGYDWGDLLDANTSTLRYPTNSVNNVGEGVGASHLIVPNLRIGTIVDAEATGSSSPLAGLGTATTGDDINGSDDEDGVTFPSFTVGTPADIAISVTNNTGTSATLYSYIDWNRDGTFGSGETFVTPVPLSNDPNPQNLLLNVTPPLNTKVGGFRLYTRFRLSTNAAAAVPTGEAPSGEVEDYFISVAGFDRGDLPDAGTNATAMGDYRTLDSDNGPIHTINSNVFMGQQVDAEIDGQPSANANGDDNTSDDDEDGVTIPALIAGQTATITVAVQNLTAAANANLYGFIDFNADGDFLDVGEATNVVVVPFGTNPTTMDLTIAVPADAVINKPLGARFRLGTAAGSSSVGNGAAGEIEDYMVTITGYDYGDLPDNNTAGSGSYPTNTTNGGGEGIGPRHRIVDGLKMGTIVDAEGDGIPSATANGDDLSDTDPGAGTDDEDGTTLPMFIAGQTATVSVNVMNMMTVPAAAKLVAYFDWNDNGVFEAGEMVSENIPDGTNALVNLSVPVPTTAVINNDLGVRFRLSSDSEFTLNMPATGEAANGEVEDYVTQVMAFDYGDLNDPSNGTMTAAPGTPANYQTRTADSGPSHKILTDAGGVYTLTIGTNIDDELDGQSSSDAGRTTGGDDNTDTPDDEDGLNYATLSPFIVTQTATLQIPVTNNTGSDAKLTVFIDFNKDGAFDASEMFSPLALIPTGTNNVNQDVSILVPGTAVVGDNLGLRIRLANNSAEAMSPTGAASSGEVEDYVIQVAGYDFGDLPDDFYNTSGNDNPPRHIVSNNLKLGASVDAEVDGFPDAMAGAMGGGDDGNVGLVTFGTSTPPGDDENGITFATPLIPGSTATILVDAMNMTGSAAVLQGWIDWNGDGDFDVPAEELVFTNGGAGNVPSPAGLSGASLTFNVPATATFAAGNAMVRFRLSPLGGLSPSSQTAPVPLGEVEDYKVTLGKVGNLVWEDRNFDGRQDNPVGEAGINGVTVTLTWLGADGVVGGSGLNADVAYPALQTGSGSFQQGEYYFCGLTDGPGANDNNYKITYATPANMTPTRANQAAGDNELDSDGTITGMDLTMAMETFSFTFPTPTAENGNGDAGGAVNGFPDNQTDESHDQGFAFLDYGDLPQTPPGDDFNTTMAEDGAVHAIVPNLKLGASVDPEQDGTPSANANGDDNNNTGSADDEDGVTFATPLIPGNNATITVTAMNTTGSDAVLQGWIDWDNDGVLSNGEQLTFSSPAGGVIASPVGATNAPFTFAVPANAIFNDGMVFARFRLSPTGGLTADGPDKYDNAATVPPGEVEDYKMNLAKVGNYVWQDYDFDGQQDAGEPAINGVPVTLTWFGADGTPGGAGLNADVIYASLATGPAGGFQAGEYYYCGLTAGSYKLTYATPANMTPTRPNRAGGNNVLDSDGTITMVPMDLTMAMETFTIANVTALPTNENGLGDSGAPGVGTFPDAQTDETHDQGFAFLDYGDLPSGPGFPGRNYQTTMEQVGPVHVILPNFKMGASVDGERDGAPNANGTGDDALNTGSADDEDGVGFAASVPLPPGGSFTIPVTAMNPTGAPAVIQGWFDWNDNGTFEPGEQIAPITVPTTGLNAVPVTVPVPASVSLTMCDLYARFRLSPTGGLNPTGPDKDGVAVLPQGEVEDYKVLVAPTATCPSNIVRNNDPGICGAAVSYTAPVPYVCPGWTLDMLQGLPSGSTFPVGVTTVQWKVTDATGFMTSCSFTVTVNDVEKPSITCPNNISKLTDPDMCGAVVNHAVKRFSDNCPGTTTSLFSGPASGTKLAPGMHTVTYQATDASLNTVQCTFTITVADGQAPAIKCPANLTAATNANACNATVTYPKPTATDNCTLPAGQPTHVSGGTGTITNPTTATATFSTGITTVTWRATDGVGLTKTCSFRVIVYDTQAPTVTCPTIAPVNTAPGTCSAVVTYTNATATDNCTANPVVARIKGPASGSTFAAGTTRLVFRATDAAGRSATCSVLVTVVDNQPPVITCPGNITATGGGIPCRAVVSYAPATATDNCDGVLSPFQIQGLASGSVFPAGVTTNTWRAKATNGQESECSFTVTINNCPSVSGGDTESRDDLAGAAQAGLRLAPNPADDRAIAAVEGLGVSGGRLLLFDVAGRLVWEQKLPPVEGEQQIELPVGILQQGAYQVALRTSERTVVKPLMIVHK